MKQEITYEDYNKVEIKVGTVLKVSKNEKARKPSLVVEVDFGGKTGVRKSSAQITHRYSTEDLINKQVIAVVNFPKKQIANFISECLVLGAVNEKDVILISPEDTVMNGLKIH
jgi:tRNA-binding protein